MEINILSFSPQKSALTCIWIIFCGSKRNFLIFMATKQTERSADRYSIISTTTFAKWANILHNAMRNARNKNWSKVQMLLFVRTHANANYYYATSLLATHKFVHKNICISKMSVGNKIWISPKCCVRQGVWGWVGWNAHSLYATGAQLALHAPAALLC